MSKDRADWLEGQADVLRGWMDTLTVSNHAETAWMSCGNDPGTYLATGDTKRLIHETDGDGIHADVSSGHLDMPSAEMDARTAANPLENVSIPQQKQKPLDLPMEAAWQHPDKPNSFSDQMDRSSVHTDAHSIETGMEMSENIRRNVRMPRNEWKTQNLPYTHEIMTPKPTYRWRTVSVGDGGMYVPLNAPIETASRTFAFGRLESREEAIVPKVEGEGAVGGNGNRDGDDDGEGGTTSNDHADLSQVEEALLAGDSQYKCQGRRK